MGGSWDPGDDRQPNASVGIWSPPILPGPINDYFGDGIGIVIKSDHNVSAVDFIFYGVRVKRPQEDTIGSTIYSSSSSFFFHQVVVQRLIWSGRGPWQCSPFAWKHEGDQYIGHQRTCS